ncbi:uncharacterized protein PHACADRAFT_208569 [Phanerochaete carnosa HHB-10118-sp]|uniref:DUF3669 domain-containing protein n=1 Tax=Phanerochaete carnosa (strain HHB-10118-sp) TaxID=650164 RepID=K5W791_PHACS|nr:uncharacterized protein PHACADRAFT_208569 [Phanerochaete carnosa HHB-10118-sp]EKM55040.1 hypothetical protein PHACADRAFT_208569 [Phanerochaete carnosa HHB-10118-sp]
MSGIWPECPRSAGTVNVEDEPTGLVRVGAGSFATVCAHRGGPLVFKIVHFEEQAQELKAEYTAHNALFTSYPQKFTFAVPRPLGFYGITNQDYLELSTNIHFHLSGQYFESVGVPRSAYAMDRVHTLPADIGNVIRVQFYSRITEARSAPYSSLCRLYLSKVLKPSMFLRFESRLMPLNDVARGMGEVLGHIHWRLGYDARDIEFVMGGDGYHGVTFQVIDFNQMRRLEGTGVEVVEMLVSSFFANDPYYPRPRPSDTLYQAFRTGYIAQCALGQTSVPKEFLEAIEVEQAKRDARE